MIIDSLPIYHQFRVVIHRDMVKEKYSLEKQSPTREVSLRLYSLVCLLGR